MASADHGNSARRDANTQRRMARMRAERDAALNGTTLSQSDFAAQQAASSSQAAAASAGSNFASWAVLGAAAVGGALLMRTVLKGTAPSNTSRYQAFKHEQSAPHSPYSTRHTTASSGAHAHSSQQQHRSHQQTHSRPHDTHSYAHDSQSHSQQQQAARKRRTDYEKFEEFQQQEKAGAFGRKPAGTSAAGYDQPYTPFREHDPDFELQREQARADFVQSKWLHMKKSKRILKYSSWGGTKDGAAQEDGEYDEDDEEFNAQYSAFRSMQRQLATLPKYLQARQIIFGDGVIIPAVPASSPFAVRSELPELTSEGVRAAYFARAKEVHPDKPGGDKVRFQQLTEAYELLMTTLEAMEKRSPAATAASEAADADAKKGPH